VPTFHPVYRFGGRIGTAIHGNEKQIAKFMCSGRARVNPARTTAKSDRRWDGWVLLTALGVMRDRLRLGEPPMIHLLWWVVVPGFGDL
jgi:hypothetical protein